MWGMKTGPGALQVWWKNFAMILDQSSFQTLQLSCMHQLCFHRSIDKNDFVKENGEAMEILYWISLIFNVQNQNQGKLAIFPHSSRIDFCVKVDRFQ